MGDIPKTIPELETPINERLGLEQGKTVIMVAMSEKPRGVEIEMFLTVEEADERIEHLSQEGFKYFEVKSYTTYKVTPRPKAWRLPKFSFDWVNNGMILMAAVIWTYVIIEAIIKGK